MGYEQEGNEVAGAQPSYVAMSRDDTGTELANLMSRSSESALDLFQEGGRSQISMWLAQQSRSQGMTRV